MKNLKVLDGNEACALASYKFTENCGIYPITPASPMATLTDKWANAGKKNILGENVKVVEMQSEAGAAGFVHGSLQAGLLTTTFTASQGLLLMLPEMYKIAGELLPGVIHVAARSLSTHALSIFGDHQDVYAARMTGFAMISSSNVQDAYYLSLISHLSAIKGSIPFLHFMDGFRTSHEINKINILEDETIKTLIDYKSIQNFRKRSLNIGKAITRGVSETEDVYFQNTEARNKYYEGLPDIVNEYMEKINEITGTTYKPFTYYGAIHAKHIIVAMGSVIDTIKKVVEDLNKQEESVGVITVHLYRPFSAKYFLNILPKTVEKITVLDRTKEAGSLAEPLYLDISTALKGENIEIVGGRYGLSSKNTTPSQIKSVYDNMSKYKMKDHFTIGITDDVTNTNLEEKEYKLSEKYKEIKVYGFGSDGMVSASKNILKVIGEKDGNYIQGYFEYDSKKSGGVTVSHLRISDTQINAPYYLTEPNLIVVSKDTYIEKYDILEGIKKGGILLLNSKLGNEELNKYIPNNIKDKIKENKVKFYVTDADTLAEKYKLRGKINNIISIYIMKILGLSGEDIVKFKENIKAVYSDKGNEVIEANIKALDESMDYLREIDITKLTETKKQEEKTGLIETMLSRRANNLKVSDFLPHADGTFEGGTSASDKRKISNLVPKWRKENCIECNACAFICPHAIIRSLSLTESEIKKSPIDKEDTIPSIGETEKEYYISINTANCTGCTLCSKICPGKNGEKALTMEEPDHKQDEICDYFNERHVNQVKFPKYSVKGLGFTEPVFEFPGACAGCGETVYIRTLTELYAEEIVIANATGCSSIYGASLPCTPYKIPWISSLFEDNAEFGLGLHTAYKIARNRIKEIMIETKDEVESTTKEIYKTWLDNQDNSEITLKVQKELKNKKIREDLESLLDYIPSRTVWIIGGDGWAYDIGYGGLDHVLRTNENIKVLVLDTEVYSNTGGQTSKSTRIGAVAEFSSTGKLKPKKDLFRIAMSIPNVYVASISAGASREQTIKAFKEANEHKGPSIIIAYSPCIAHGIKGGLSNSIEEQKLLVESGYNILMRYNPEEDKLYIDSKEPNFQLYETVFAKEMRYKNLETLNEKEYEKLYITNMTNAKKRYEYYEKLSKDKMIEKENSDLKYI
ncbi:MAG: pyruvate:ferredoxin (flavodoxin) oxidoreductase [Bacilli bacterium]|nr:pyruvate:ferredoxin (flavodoxin) oxidoreductase [Bacilli bacterium]